MDSLFEYIDRLGVPDTTKWLLLRMCVSGETMFTQAELRDFSGLDKRPVAQHLYRLIKARIVSWRAHHMHKHVIVYWISDHHLRHRIAAQESKPHFNRN